MTDRNPLPFQIEYLFIIIVLLVAVVIFTMYLLESKKKYEKFNTDKSIFYMFHTEWCGHSKKMFPIFEIVQEESVTINGEINALKDLVEFKPINCEDDKEKLCSTFKIKYLPTLILIRNGKKIKYTGGPELEKLYLFLKKELV
tara:strand:- start:264 stop:692 length:429 start_codon:yes stop_codon:yes gene_type:complete